VEEKEGEEEELPAATKPGLERAAGKKRVAPESTMNLLLFICSVGHSEALPII